MSEQTVIDGFELTRMSRSLGGKIDVSSLDRVADALYSNSGRIDYAVTGEIDGENNHLLHLSISGTLHLKCQRCLGDVEYPLQLQANLKLVRDESELGDIEDEDPDVDSIVVKDKLEILSMIEDEILLDLPFSPRHVECGIDAARESPFSILKGRF